MFRISGKRIMSGLCIFSILSVVFTVIVNYKVQRYAETKIYGHENEAYNNMKNV